MNIVIKQLIRMKTNGHIEKQVKQLQSTKPMKGLVKKHASNENI